jgi:OCT family organic cation transporter-like MFS transporter 4/5
MLGKFSINMSFTIIYIYGPEIYPTVLRNTGTGVGSMCGRIGGILYPYINYLSKLEHPISRKLPLIVFGLLSLIGGFMAVPLPETRQNPLPETIDDIENYKEFCRKHKQRNDEQQNGGVELNHML